jgi:SecD/SecF fusion protein
MQNKAFISFIAIVLALACLYHLSFTVITKKVESDAAAYANGDPDLEKAYLDSLSVVQSPSNDAGWFSKAAFSIKNQFSYASAKQRELNLGLDLKGGMNLTIEVSVADLLTVMTNDTQDPTFTKALATAKSETAKNGSDLINNFVKAAQAIDPNVQFSSARMFGHSDQSAIKVGMSNDEVVKVLRKEADLAIERTFEVLNSRIDQFGVTQPNIQKLEATGRILIELPGIRDPERAVELVQKTAKLEFWETVNMRDVVQSYVRIDEYLAKIKKAVKDTGAVAATASAVATEPDSNVTEESPAFAAAAEGDSSEEDSAEGAFGKKNTSVKKEDSPLFSILNLNVGMDPATQQMVYGQGPVLGYVLPTDTAEFNAYMRIPQVAAMAPKNVRLMWGYKTQPMYEGVQPLLPLYCIYSPQKGGKAVLEGDVVTNAEYEKNPDGGGFMVRMFMNGEGSDKWAKITEANSPKGSVGGKSIAIALDGMVYSAPTVQDKITGGISTITGNFSFEESKSLAAVLKSGKLPVPATIVEKAVVGPTMGSQAINSGLISMGIAFLLVLVFMGFYYSGAGMTANLALLCNVFFQMGTLASLGTTLTLPGIAGIVLSFAMSVDSNVLIFERIREELREGKGLRIAVSEGFKHAYSSIIDGNMTALITAIILMIFGAGPTKGFAVTLFVGILSSMFSAIFITRLVFEAQLARKKNISFSYKWSEDPFSKIHINFVGKRKIFYVLSTVAILLGVVSYSIKGFNLGVDLQGGRTYTVALDNSDFETTAIADALTPQFEDEPPIVKMFGTDNRIKIVTKYKYNESSPEAETMVETQIYDALKPFYKDAPTIEQFRDQLSGDGIVGSEKVGPTIAGSTKTKSIYAIVISLFLIFMYILFRFKGWQFGFGFFVAVTHDVLIVLTAYTIFDGILPFSMEIDQAIIAAILTVIGYSLNDTVVVFDRVREYMHEKRHTNLPELFNDALNSTLSRTVITSGITMLVLLMTFLFGGTGLKSMSFSLLVGIAAGTYSSLFLASPMVMDMMQRFPSKKEGIPSEKPKEVSTPSNI